MMVLKDLPVGSFVTLWCVGLRYWDNVRVVIVRKGILIDVKYPNGDVRSFSQNTPCR